MAKTQFSQTMHFWCSFRQLQAEMNSAKTPRHVPPSPKRVIALSYVHTLCLLSCPAPRPKSEDWCEQ